MTEEGFALIAIAIDGPAGAGKSTLARALAQKLAFSYVDTGALYRAIGLCAVNSGVDLQDADGIAGLLKGITLRLAYDENGKQLVYLNGEDVSEKIRRNDISAAASAVAAVPQVRSFLLETQRETARRNHVIMDGRDIGTTVLPQAQIKLFLTASPQERARRRYEELRAKGQEVPYEILLQEVNQRDYNDSHRSASPLRRAEDAILVDTSGETPEESADRLAILIKERLGNVAL